MRKHDASEEWETIEEAIRLAFFRDYLSQPKRRKLLKPIPHPERLVYAGAVTGC